MITSLTCLRLIRVRVGTEHRVSERIGTLQQLLAGLKGFRVLEELVFEGTELFASEASGDEIGTGMREIAAVGSSLQRLRFKDVFLASEHLHCFTALGGLEELQLHRVRFRPNTIKREFDFVQHLPRISKLELCNQTEEEIDDFCYQQSWNVLQSLSASASLQHLVIDIYLCCDLLPLGALTALTYLELKFRHFTGGMEGALAPIRSLTNLQALVLDQVRDRLPPSPEDEEDEPMHIPICDSLSQLADLPCLQSLTVVMKGLHHGWESERGDEGERNVSVGVLNLYGVAALTRLTSLTLGIRMDRNDLSALIALPNLRRLAFQGGTRCRIGCEELADVAEMESLEEVDLRECEVDAYGLSWLAYLPRLKHLRLNDKFKEHAGDILACTAIYLMFTGEPLY